MELQDQAPARQTPLRRALNAFSQHYEQGAFYILLLWCLLPVIMSVSYVISGIQGVYPTAEELIKDGLTPGYVNYDEALHAYQTLFFILGAITGCFALLCVVLCRKRVFSLRSVRRMPWYYLLVLFLLWAFICSLRSEYVLISLRGSSYMRDGFLSYCIYGAVFLCASVLRDERRRKTILRCFAAVIVYLALIVVVQESVDIAFINYIFSSRRAAVFNQFNHFGYMLCMAIITCFGLFLHDRDSKPWLRWLYLAGALFLVYAMIVNDTFGAVLAVIAAVPAVLVFYVRSGRRLHLRTAAFILVLALLAGAAFFALYAERTNLLHNFTQFKEDLIKIITRAADADTAGTNRLRLWRESVQIIRKYPVMGVGPEGLGGSIALTDNLLPHNTYLQIALYTGLVGLALYLAALLSLVKDRWQYIRKLEPMVLVASGSAFAYMVSAFVGCPVFNTEPYFWLFLGIVSAAHIGRKPLLCPDAAEEPDEEEGQPTALERAARAFPRRYERAAFRLLFLWCLLPAAALVPGSTVFQTLFFVLGAVTLCFAIFCLVVCRKQIFSLQAAKQRPWIYPLCLLALWALASALLSDYFYRAFLGSARLRSGLASIFIYAGVFVCAAVLRDGAYRKKLLRCFVWVVGCLGLVLLIRKAAGGAAFLPALDSYEGLDRLLGMALVCAAALLVWDQREEKGLNWLYLVPALCLACALAFHGSFAAVLSAVIALIMLLLFPVRSGKKADARLTALVLALAVLVAAGFFALGDPAQAGIPAEAALSRVDALHRIGERPLFGFGPEGFIDGSVVTEAQRPHNEYLQLGGDLGLPALVLGFAAFLLLAWRRLRGARPFDPLIPAALAAAAAYLISAVAGDAAYSVSPAFWLFLGLAAGMEDAPLCPAEETNGQPRRAVLHTKLGVLACALLCLGAGLSLKAEKKLELADLETMLAAETAAKSYIDPARVNADSPYYWYDKKGGYVYSILLPAPEPYGKGTRNSGGGSAAFYREHGVSYRYDESADYSGKLIVIAAAPDPSGGLKVEMSWYAPKG